MPGATEISGTENEVIRGVRLIERLNAGCHTKFTLVSAPAGFGKTTLLSEWVTGCGRPVG
jgi:LuxR family maltose regulon positive regulatory protein